MNKLKANHCFEFTPSELFEVDDGLNLACYCPKCEMMVTIDYAHNKSEWEAAAEEELTEIKKLNSFWSQF